VELVCVNESSPIHLEVPASRPIEKTLEAIIVCSATLVIFPFFAGSFNLYSAAGIVVVAVAFGLRSRIQSEYVIDRESGYLVLNRVTWGHRVSIPLVSVKDMRGLTICWKEVPGKSASEWDYWGALLVENGDPIRISKHSTGAPWSARASTARLCELLRLPYFDSEAALGPPASDADSSVWYPHPDDRANQGVLLLDFWARKDTRYALDRVHRELVAIRVPSGETSPVTTFQEIFAVTTTAEDVSSITDHPDVGARWAHQGIAVLKDGRTIAITAVHEWGIHQIRAQAQELAKLVDCPFIDGPDEGVLVVKPDPATKTPLIRHK